MQQIDQPLPIPLTKLEREDTTRENYRVKEFNIHVFKRGGKQYYSVEQNTREVIVRKIIKKVKQEIILRNREFQGHFLKFNEKYQLIYSTAINAIASYRQEKVSTEVITLRILGFSDLIPLFLDPNIEEVYFSSQDLTVILDHKEQGRCIYEHRVTLQEVQTLIRHAELEAEMILQPLHPSLKVAIQISDTPLRISIDGPPLSTKGYLISIRKQKQNPFTLEELIQRESLTNEQANTLRKIIRERKNIVIVGEPNSGKTTLAQAILLLTPEHWKVICIEDTSELSTTFYQRKNVWAIEVPPLDSTRGFTTKKQEILKLLHRSPDYVFIGEVQSKEHSKAMFEMLSAGLKGLQTIHSDSLENLLKRWVFQHEISQEQLFSLDYIILMRRTWKGQKIKRGISEIIKMTPELIEQAVNA